MKPQNTLARLQWLGIGILLIGGLAVLGIPYLDESGDPAFEAAWTRCTELAQRADNGLEGPWRGQMVEDCMEDGE